MNTRTSTSQGRPRNAEATRQRILAAARKEFSGHGFAGARVDRIAELAGANKRMIYAYFGDKDRLYEALMERQIAEWAEAVPFTPDDLAAYAIGRFEYMRAHPDVRRLAAWRTIEQSKATEAERSIYQARIDALAAAQRAGKVSSAIPATDLYAMVARLTESWLSAAPALQATSRDPLGSKRLAQHRKALVEAVRRISAPR